MSRSKRRTPIFGMTLAESEKADKRIANRRLRAHERVAFASGREVIPGIRDVSSTWTFAKDGRQYWRNAAAEDMRK
jgi:hypothetical protein